MPEALEPDCERTLIEAVPNDPRAFEHLYNHYLPRLYAYTYYRVGATQDSEDLVADIFTQAVAAMKNGQFHWRREGSFAAWLFRIAHNRLHEYRRKKRGESLVHFDELSLVRSNYPLPEEVLLQKEQFAQLHRLILTLSPRREEVISLKFFGQLHNSEIALILGLDERTVASHLSRGLQDLYRKYQGIEGQTQDVDAQAKNTQDKQDRVVRDNG